MVAKKRRSRPRAGAAAAGSLASSSVEELLLAALERGDDSFETGRSLVTFKEGAAQEGLQFLGTQGLRVASTRDFDDRALNLEAVGGADAVFLPEIGVALLGGEPAQERGLSAFAEIAADSPIESIDPEYFVFVDGAADEYYRGLGEEAETNSREYLRGFIRAAETIAKDLGLGGPAAAEEEAEAGAQVLGATWGLNVCRVPLSSRSGAGIRLAVLDTGLDLGHPDFAGRPIVSRTFVGQPVQDLHGHGTHVTGTAAGTRTPPGAIPRYGIAFRSNIFIGKVLTNSGSGTQIGILAGMAWAIANRCTVINMSLGGPGGPHPAYTAAGQNALNNGCLIIAAAGNAGPGPTMQPANSPTIMAVASLDPPPLRPSSFSCRGKIEIAAPGRDIFSSWPRPIRYKTISGTSMACPHVVGCGALWAETSPALRAMNLWNRLRATARPLPFPPTQVGRGCVQAPVP
ncbi:MAG TPA: S8 family serine peptidase [Pyrinomonadaceae bacterium]|nr:S8 family serine peptidase [Pyrinomonadaceae bacterium]